MVVVGLVTRFWPQATGLALGLVVAKALLRKGQESPTEETPEVPQPQEPVARTFASATEQDLTDVPVEVLTEEEQPADAPGDEWKEIAACDLPCSVLDFFAAVLSTRSNVLQEGHKGAGHFDIVKGGWEKQDGSRGLVRELFFVTPVKGPIGPKQTRVIQRHNVTLHPGSVLHYLVTQQNLDIPFKECFSVNFWWVAAPTPTGCRVSIRLSVPFTKWCAFKGLIISTTFKDCTAFCTALLQHAQKVTPISAPPPVPPAVGFPASPTKSRPPGAPPATPWNGTLAGNRSGSAAAALAIVCCGLQLWVLSQAWAAGCGSAVAACSRADVRVAGGPLVEWQPVAGAGAAVVSLLLCLLQMRG